MLAACLLGRALRITHGPRHPHWSATSSPGTRSWSWLCAWMAHGGSDGADSYTANGVGDSVCTPERERDPTPPRAEIAEGVCCTSLHGHAAASQWTITATRPCDSPGVTSRRLYLEACARNMLQAHEGKSRDTAERKATRETIKRERCKGMQGRASCREHVFVVCGTSRARPWLMALPLARAQTSAQRCHNGMCFWQGCRGTVADG